MNEYTYYSDRMSSILALHSSMYNIFHRCPLCRCHTIPVYVYIISLQLCSRHRRCIGFLSRIGLPSKSSLLDGKLLKYYQIVYVKRYDICATYIRELSVAVSTIYSTVTALINPMRPAGPALRYNRKHHSSFIGN